MRFVFVILLHQVLSACIKYTPNNPQFYCDDIVSWPVSDEVWENRFEQNRQALELYRNLKIN